MFDQHNVSDYLKHMHINSFTNNGASLESLFLFVSIMLPSNANDCLLQHFIIEYQNQNHYIAFINFWTLIFQNAFDKLIISFYNSLIAYYK